MEEDESYDCDNSYLSSNSDENASLVKKALGGEENEIDAEDLDSKEMDLITRINALKEFLP